MDKQDIDDRTNIRGENEEPLKLVRSSKVVGTVVKSLDGEDLGNIDDVVVDISKGDFSYVVVAAGGFLGIGEKLISIPWDVLMFDEETKSFILKVHHKELENAAGVSADSWDVMESKEWQDEFKTQYLITWDHISPMISNIRHEKPLTKAMAEARNRILP